MLSNYTNYLTKQGDTFDLLALNEYDNEFLSHVIIQANPQYADIVKFDANIKLKIPVVGMKAAEVLPPWKR